MISVKTVIANCGDPGSRKTSIPAASTMMNRLRRSAALPIPGSRFIAHVRFWSYLSPHSSQRFAPLALPSETDPRRVAVRLAVAELSNDDVAGHLAPIVQPGQGRELDVAQAALEERAARVEGTAARQVEQARDLHAAQQDLLLLARQLRIRLRNRRQQRARVGVSRLGDELGRRRALDDPPQVHHRGVAALPEI